MNNFFFICCICFTLVACGKSEDTTLSPNAQLTYSTDSVLFDTVFTSIGSTSRRLKIFNYNKYAINIDHIQLAGGNNSAFAININGVPQSDIKNLKLNGNDSINVFVKANINPDNQNTPFIVEDSIVLNYNGTRQKIPLVAYGQNAIFLNQASISTNTVWDSKLPYIIYNSLTIEKNTTLQIAGGTRVLFHKNGTLNIKGTLKVNGNKTDSVLFASDRMERLYQDEPGQWNGLHFYGTSQNSSINYVVIKNAIVGITADSLSINENPKLLLANSIVKNMQVVGFFGYHTELAAFNNLFFNCGQYLLYGIGGGSYNLKQNTFAAYNFTFLRKTPAVYLSDYINDQENDAMQANLTNNIIWGSLDDEYLFEKKTNKTASIELENNLIKTKNTALAAGNILNTDPLFIAPRYGLFQLQFGSPALNGGASLLTDPYFVPYLHNDLLGEIRKFPSELGCYEAN